MVVHKFEYKPVETNIPSLEDINNKYLKSDNDFELTIDQKKQKINIYNNLSNHKNILNHNNLANDKNIPNHKNIENVDKIALPPELCTVYTALENKWLSPNISNYFNLNKSLDQSIIKTTTNDFIKNEKQYSICTSNNDNTKAYKNCALTSPWRTLQNEKCQIKEGYCPPSFEFKNGSCILPKENLQYFQRDKKGFCENKWYDWFSIPNYHLSNGYQKYVKGGSHKKDITKCFKPCELGTIPFNMNRTDVNNKNHVKCIKKSNANFGLYGRNDYCPISMILLLNIDKKYLKDSLMNKIKIPEVNRRENIYNKQQNEIIDTAYNDVIINAKKYIIESGIQPKDLSKPKLGDLEFDPCIEIGTHNDLIKAYDICKQLSDKSKEKEIRTTINNIYGYNDERILNKHMKLLYKSCSKCFEIKDTQSYLKPANNDYSNAILNRLNGEFPDIERKSLIFDDSEEVIDEKLEIESPLFGLNDILKIFGSYSTSNLKYSQNSFYNIPNLLIYFINTFILFVVIYIIYKILILLYPYFRKVIFFILWLLMELYIRFYKIFSTIRVLPKSAKQTNPFWDYIFNEKFEKMI
jgi:hypothetical protein